MMRQTPGLGRCEIGGASGEIGHLLGLAGRDAVRRFVVTSPLWKMVTSAALADAATRMAHATRALFPDIHEELGGLADGLGLPFDQVFAWNARGDLLAGAGEGCTTVQIPGGSPVIAHNEDGLPTLRGACFLANLRPVAGPEAVSFCYPGSIPGHSFATSDAGLVITVNNLRLNGLTAEIPRMVLTRAILSAPDRAGAVAILRDAPPSGGFHLSLGQAGQSDIWSVTFGGGEVMVVEHCAANVHSNHALVHGTVLSRQTITDSSRDRLARGRDLLDGGADPLAILRDTGGHGLPNLREAADDPDHENTIAQFQARIGTDATEWQVHVPGTDSPVHHGRLLVCRRNCHA